MKRKFIVVGRRVEKIFIMFSEKLRKRNIVRGKFVTNDSTKKGIFYQTFYRQHRDILTVGKDKEFQTIEEAIKNSNDTPLNPVTICVSPGTYLESVKLKGGRYISIVGDSKDACIIQNNSGNYWTPPLEIAGKSSIKNMTLIATSEDGKTHVLPSYAIHHDFAGEGTSLISNCKLVSYQHAAIGVGLHNNQTLIVENCEMFSTARPGLFAHNRKKNDAKNQKLIVKDSVIESMKGTPVRLQDSNHREGGGFGDEKDTEFGFYNNVFKSGDLDQNNLFDGNDKPLDEHSLVGYIRLMKGSKGNNISELNMEEAVNVH